MTARGPYRTPGKVEPDPEPRPAGDVLVEPAEVAVLEPVDDLAPLVGEARLELVWGPEPQWRRVARPVWLTVFIGWAIFVLVAFR